MPPANATSRPAARTTTVFWWCDPARRTRWSSSTSPPASFTSSLRWRFSSSLYDSSSWWLRQTSPLTTTPRLAASPNSVPTVGPSGRIRSSESPRQSVKKRWSSGSSADTTSTRRAKYADPCTWGTTALPTDQSGSP